MSEWKTVSQSPRWYELLIARLILADGRPGWWRTFFGSTVAEGPYTRLRFSAEDEGLMRMVSTPTTCYTDLFLTTADRFASLRPTMENTLAHFTPL